MATLWEIDGHLIDDGTSLLECDDCPCEEDPCGVPCIVNTFPAQLTFNFSGFADSDPNCRCPEILNQSHAINFDDDLCWYLAEYGEGSPLCYDCFAWSVLAFWELDGVGGVFFRVFIRRDAACTGSDNDFAWSFVGPTYDIGDLVNCAVELDGMPMTLVTPGPGPNGLCDSSSAALTLQDTSP